MILSVSFIHSKANLRKCCSAETNWWSIHIFKTSSKDIVLLLGMRWKLKQLSFYFPYIGIFKIWLLHTLVIWWLLNIWNIFWLRKCMLLLTWSDRFNNVKISNFIRQLVDSNIFSFCLHFFSQPSFIIGFRISVILL